MLDYVIRFQWQHRRHRHDGRNRTAAAWVRSGKRACVLRGAAVTADRYLVGTVVCVQDPDMKQACALAASSTSHSYISGYYVCRWGYRVWLRIAICASAWGSAVKSPERRDRLGADQRFAVVLLTLSAAMPGHDRMLKTHRQAPRPLSLSAGRYADDLILTMLEIRLRPLMQRFSQMLQDHVSVRRLPV